MKNTPCPLYTFTEATKGNWRNAAYIDCSDTACQRDNACAGFLLAFDADGYPSIMPVELFRVLSGIAIDSSECTITMKRSTFETLFSKWLAWETSQEGECILGKPGCLPKCAVS